MSEHGGLLAIITDINLEYWNRKDSMDFNTMISSVLLYINSYFLLHRENRLVWLISFASGSEIVFPTNGKDVFLDTKAEAFHSVQKNVLERIQVQMKSASEMSAANATSGMASAFSRGLCFVHRLHQGCVGPKPPARFFVLKGSSDTSAMYISMMNSIFSSQKSNIPIDACVLSKEDSSFLQQGAQLTDGVYVNVALTAQKAGVPLQDSFLQYLLTIWLCDAESRAALNLPSLENINFQAACFCHGNKIAMAYVCPVCLSMFCTYSPVCSTCGVRAYIPPNIRKKRPLEQ